MSAGRFRPPDPNRRTRTRARKDRGPCPVCSQRDWLIISDHELYRDRFLECGVCGSNFRMDLTPLDFRYAWRDGIPMPKGLTLGEDDTP